MFVYIVLLSWNAPLHCSFVLFHHVADLIHCWCCSWFITLVVLLFVLLVMLLVHHIVSIIGLSHCWCTSIALLLGLLEPPCVAIVVTLCYFFAMLVTIPIACIFFKYYPHCHCLACGKLVVHHIVVRLPLLGTHHHHLPLMVFLFVCHVVVGGVSSLCCQCHCELLPTPIALWW